MAPESENDRSSLGQLNDPNIKVVLGKPYKNFSEDLGLDKTWQDKSTLSLDEVKKLRELIKNRKTKDAKGESKPVYLNDILMESEVHIPTLEIPERDPVLEKRLNKLKLALEDKEYKRMTRNVQGEGPQSPEDSIGYQLKQMDSVIIAVIQFVISIAAAFLFGFLGIEVFVGSLDLAVRLLLGIAAAVIVGAADLYIMVVYLEAKEDPEKKVK